MQNKEPRFKFVVHTENGPISNSPQEQTRLDKRMEICVRVLKTMGYDNASPQTFNQIVTELVQKNFTKYLSFLDTVSAIAKKEGC
jgi:hypothetical protein